MGDPEISIGWLARLIDDLEERTGEVAARQRAGARFDAAKGLVLDPAEGEAEPGDEAEGDRTEDRGRSSSRSSRSRSSRSRSCCSRSSSSSSRSIASSQARTRSEADLRTVEPAATAQSSQPPEEAPEKPSPTNLLADSSQVAAVSLSHEGVTVLDAPTEQAPSSVLPTPDANLDSQVVVLAAP
jgi:hypothetical protein